MLRRVATACGAQASEDDFSAISACCAGSCELRGAIAPMADGIDADWGAAEPPPLALEVDAGWGESPTVPPESPLVAAVSESPGKASDLGILGSQRSVDDAWGDMSQRTDEGWAGDMPPQKNALGSANGQDLQQPGSAIFDDDDRMAMVRAHRRKRVDAKEFFHPVELALQHSGLDPLGAEPGQGEARAAGEQVVVPFVVAPRADAGAHAAEGAGVVDLQHAAGAAPEDAPLRAEASLDRLRYRAGLGPLQKVVAESASLAVQAAQEHPQWFDDVARRIVDRMVQTGRPKVMSESAEAELLDTSRGKLRRVKNRFAAACILIQRNNARLMMEAVVNAVLADGGEIVCLTECARYDETPMRVRVRESADLINLSSFQGDAGVAPALAGLTSQMKFVSELQKLLQVELKYMMLVKLGDMHCAIDWTLLVPVLLMARGTGENYSRCLSLVRLDLSSVRRHVGRVQRLVITDGDGAVARGERHLRDLDPGADHLHLTCMVHKAAAMKEAALALDPHTVVGLTHLTKSLRAPNALTSFRGVVRAMVWERLRIHRNAPSDPRIIERNARHLACFLPLTHRTRVQRAVLLAMANGDWSDHTAVHHHTTASTMEKSDDEIRELFSTAFVSALLWNAPANFPSRNWVEAEVAPSFFGVLALCHGLLGATFLQWLALSRDRACDMRPNRAAINQPGGDEQADAGMLGATEPLPLVPPDGPASELVLVEGVVEGDAVGAAAARERQENARHRLGAKMWLQRETCPVGVLACFRAALEPHRLYLQKLLHMAGDDWDAEQECAAASARLSGTDCPHRQFRLVIAFEGQFEDALISDCTAAMHMEELWQVVPRRGRTRQAEERVFRMMSRSACRAHRIRVRHNQYPLLLFGLLSDQAESVAARVLADNDCVKDEWSLKFCQRYGQDIGGAAAKMDLMALAILAREETVQIETRHASLRRTLQAKSVQSKLLDMEGLNQSVISRCIRHATSRKRRPFGAHNAGEQAQHQCLDGRPAVDEQPPAKKRRKLSAWDVFLGEFACRRRREEAFDRTAASEEYRALPASEKARLQAEADFQNVIRPDSATAGRQRRRPMAGVASEPLQRLSSRALEVGAAGAGMAIVGATGEQGAPPMPFQTQVMQAGLRRAGIVSDMVVGYDSSRVRLAARNERAMHQEKHSRLDGAMAKFLEEQQESRAIVAGCEGVFKHSSEADFRPSPASSHSFRHFSWGGGPIVEMAKQLVALQAGVNSVQAVQTQLDKAWEFSNLVVEPERWPHEPKNTKRKCFDAGVCLCKGEGKFLAEVASKLSQVIKAAFRKGSDDYTSLLAGHFAMSLFCSDPGPAGEADLADGTAVEPAIWCHIAEICQRPWEPFYLAMQPSEAFVAKVGDGCVQAPEPLQLQADKPEMTHLELCRALDRSKAWHVSFWVTDHNQHIIGEVLPNRLVVSPAFGGRLALVWEPRNRYRVRKSRAPDVEGWGEMAAAEVAPAGDTTSSEEERAEEGSGGDNEHEEESDAEVSRDQDADGGAESGGDDSDAHASGSGDNANAPEELLAAMVAGLGEMLPPDGDPRAGDIALGEAQARPEEPAGDPESAVIEHSLPMGTLVYYAKSKTFYAYCDDARHGGRAICRKTRQGFAGRKPWVGRPLGFLCAWLTEHDFPDRMAHFTNKPDVESRRGSRQQLKETASGRLLLSKEREQRDGEESEPEDFT